jgi:hypothetical protein
VKPQRRAHGIGSLVKVGLYWLAWQRQSCAWVWDVWAVSHLKEVAGVDGFAAFLMSPLCLS